MTKTNLLLTLTCVLGLTGCSPIITDRMPCAGDIYFDVDSRPRFQLWGAPRLRVTVAWMDVEGYNSPTAVGIVLRGLSTRAGWTRPLNEAELAQICEKEYISDRIPDGNRIRVKRFLAPTKAERSEGAFKQTFTLASPRQLKAYRSDPIDAVEITFVEFDQDFYWVQRITRDTVPVLGRQHWEVTITEIDPCYEPPRRYFMERYRKRVFVD